MGRISGNKGVRPQCERVLPSYVKPESDSRGKRLQNVKCPYRLMVLALTMERKLSNYG
jgi:hypothetical protein